MYVYIYIHNYDGGLAPRERAAPDTHRDLKEDKNKNILNKNNSNEYYRFYKGGPGLQPELKTSYWWW